MEHTESQKQAILERLKQGGSITSMEALRDFGCFRLASRISDLRSEGVGIEKTMEEGVSQHTGKTVRYARYRLAAAEQTKEKATPEA